MNLLKDIRKTTLILCAALGIANQFQAYASETMLAPQDFYKGAELETSSDSPFYRVILPKSVYLETAYSDLRDIRIFNKLGQPMTYSMTEANMSRSERQEVAFQVFPMQKERGMPDGYVTGNHYVTLKSPEGVEINFYDREGDKFDSTYLLKLDENSKLPSDKAINQIVLDWASLPDNWQTRARVYSSDDLKAWTRQIKDAPLMELKSDAGHVLLNHIEIPNNNKHRYRYWVLILENAPAQLPIINGAKGVSVTHYTQTESVNLSFNVDRLSETEAIYRFDKPQVLSNLLIYPKQYNAVLPINVEYRTHPKSAWHQLSNSVIYHIDGTKGENMSDQLPLKNLLVQELRIRAVSGSWGNDTPVVVGKRNQIDVVFNAQGNAPYILVWGANNVSSAAMDINELIPKGAMPENGVRGLPVAKQQTDVVLGGKGRLDALSPTEKAAQWQKWLLWGILISGVFGLAFVTFKLIKEMTANKES
ncbi:DUF3999 family protein [Xenorhabdus szentirmaii]|uniref:DUF3999 family protein n=1 Tax=Xenorhabdus szentirmaii TaxID=290112 RepID=UPI00198D4594|nr:DUF3999 family protein [Xenorhabdus sp. CUL]MBD2792845.1 DUF3999 family protein [Xenorhabdus sp. CUL]